MSNLRDSLSERNIEVNRPSISESHHPQPFQQKCSNKSKESSKVPASNFFSKQQLASKSKKKQKGETKTTGDCDNINLANNLPNDCENLNSENDDQELVRSAKPSKRKNAKKKERLKNLQIKMIPKTSPPVMIPHTAPVYFTPVIQNDNNAVQDLFKTQISSLYAPTNSRYLENLTHHPQFQYVQGFHGGHSSQYVPFRNEHMYQRNTSHNLNVNNIHPGPSSAPATPRYLQNLMQHPLFSESYSLEHNLKQLNLNESDNNTHSNPEGSNEIRSNQKKRNKKRKQNENNDNKFEPYLTEEEIELGLANNTLIDGVLRINPKQFQHSYVSSCNDRSEQDVLIDGIKHRNRALEGDVVVVQILNDGENEEDNKQKKGKVVHIKEKVHNRTCIGILKLMNDKNRQRALFVPRDYRIPRLNVPFTNWPDNFYEDAKQYENTLFLAKIFDWFDTRFALGNIICNIGESGDMVSETRAILAQSDLDITPYGPQFKQFYPSSDYIIPENEIALREDYRKLCIFSIDPSNCRDIDDAVSCRELENGNYEIGVHISDVAHFLTENNPLDEKVAEKATTIYLVEKAYHMLPDDLCMLCSLFPGVDKLAFSVFWEITKEAVVLNKRFAKTVIHSCCQLSYDHCQAILEDKENAKSSFPETYNGFEFEDIYKTIKTLGTIAQILRQSRFEGGALRIDQPKVSFHLNPTNGLPDSFWIYDSKESHQLIEEFMLLANMTVAKQIYEHYPNLAFLRCHPPPSGYMLKQLAKVLEPMGIELEISSAGDLHKSLLCHVGPDCDRGKAMVLNMLCAKPMTRAKYFCASGCDDDDFHHYALNVPLYTHFTSPIRRYADIMVHRLLAASLNYRKTPDWDVDKVRMIAAQCNKQKYNAKKAGELSTELYTLKYIEMHSPVVTEAVVVEVRDKYIDVIIVAMSLNRRIFFNNDFPGSYRCIKNDAGAKLSKMELDWIGTEVVPAVRQVIQVFSILKVVMYKGDDMEKVETKLVRPT